MKPSIEASTTASLRGNVVATGSCSEKCGQAGRGSITTDNG
ncbi:hypothetical protein J2S34_002243 [Nitrobacter winogradskyi]|uniref:Uncharacterized protein n=1 Tax=Nitrobacter winogradskyi TaxID=913 RepID=A0ACC6AIW6_NITWI|nr:hypothetical protein [Nitrobacter winogradskyi]